MIIIDNEIIHLYSIR